MNGACKRLMPSGESKFCEESVHRHLLLHRHHVIRQIRRDQRRDLPMMLEGIAKGVAVPGRMTQTEISDWLRRTQHTLLPSDGN